MLMRVSDHQGDFLLETDDSHIDGVVRRGNHISLNGQTCTVIYTGGVELDKKRDAEFRSVIGRVGLLF